MQSRIYPAGRIGFASFVSLLTLVASPAFAASSEAFVNNCAPCHQESGKGIPGSFPSLVGSKVLTGPGADPIAVVVNGRGKMPPLGESLEDPQIADAVTYARSSWGNKAAPVTAEDVAAVRKASAN